ncbi:penicillin-binding protein, beta-lactamase class C [Arthrobacter crystallopoietes BAB-32]|uniref:Penicillin-binding protein, beta-lactamase class C n=1 Tax=Arthrobacter crystallopoietes BAB-32 TaxID=1246476 RepID=N1UTX7_9MICC|nr:hydrolase [Arthrobacter crystallopoietes]EMY33861.1 penicillin-binding protein, beta-lactamase class C [Arthrobacter crystallopoietes BAB-32]
MHLDFESHNDGGLPPAGFASLQEVFARHLVTAQGGMAFCVYRAGEPLARFYGGSTVRRDDASAEVDEAWSPKTMAVMFSGTKGVVATLAAMLVDRGQLDVRKRVAEYWPEFAAGGKEAVTVAQLLSHTVGLPYVDPEPEGDDPQLDNPANARALAAQTPLWEPGTKVAYHAATYGFLLTEVFRRATGKTVGRLIAELIREPLGLEIHLGLPEELDHRVATVFRSDSYAISTYLQDPERRKIVDRMYRNLLAEGKDPFNSIGMRRGQMSAGGGIATADAMAGLYSRLADPAGEVVSAQALADATATWSEGVDAINDRPLRFGLGFELADPIGTYGPVAPAFGHSGAGGGLHGAWPGKNVGFSFLTNEMLAENQDRRAKDLLAELARLV